MLNPRNCYKIKAHLLFISKPHLVEMNVNAFQIQPNSEKQFSPFEK